MEKNFTIIGLPASGKTTYLAALWHLVEAGEVDCRLRMDRYEGDLSYLNKIAQAWRTFQKVPRTSQVGDQNVVIHLEDSTTGTKAAAKFPDLAGETFDTVVEARKCRPGFVESFDNDDGVLFFISANRKEDELSIIEFNKRMAVEAPDGGGSEGAPQSGAEPASLADMPAATMDAGDEAAIAGTVWEPKLIPRQARIVQLLTDLCRLPFAQRRRRLAVLVSAWDLVEKQGISPQKWVETHVPLVSQFLDTHTMAFETSTFGISAQGVRLDDDAAVAQATELVPSRRIKVVGPDGEGHDLTLPLTWLMSGT